MLEVHPAPDGFTAYDTDAGEAVIKFASRPEADGLIAALQIADVHAKLQQWAPHAVKRSFASDSSGSARTLAREFR